MKTSKSNSTSKQNTSLNTQSFAGTSSRVEHADILLLMLHAVFDGTEIPMVPLDQAFVDLCVKQQLTGFLYRAIHGRKDIPLETAECVKHCYSVLVGQQVQQDFYRKEIFARLHDAGVPYLPLKGTHLRDLYPSPDLRFSCDIDFFYPKERREEVNRILADLGFCQEKPDAQNDSFSLGAVHIEPHFSLNNLTEQYEQYYSDIWLRLVTDDGIEYHFSDEDFYCFLLLHTYKHMIHGGAGVRSVIDLWLWNRAHPTMDREYLTDEWIKLGLARFVPMIEHLSRVWFCGEAGDADTALLTDYIFAGGAYGSYLQGAQVSVAKQGHGKRLSFLWHRAFPTYRQMCLRYPWLARVPVLLPFCYFLRWAQTIFSPNRNKIWRDWAVSANISGETGLDVERIRDLLG